VIPVVRVGLGAAARKEGKTQQQAADLVGCHHSAVSRWEQEVIHNVRTHNTNNPCVKRTRGRKTKLSRWVRQQFRLTGELHYDTIISICIQPHIPALPASLSNPPQSFRLSLL